ncbi:MAG TPA: signal recognition particle protein [Thermoplasmata archaeon]|nr:signal recognition particle protein [Thermoplasmata archaeon]HIH97950.1 signal recognition particle protein [Thermoplasmata archaeon]
MVLEKLGGSLRGTINRIANAIHVNKKLINEVTRELQRSLLQADVQVKLVFELTQKIEKRALEEKPPAGMSSQEHTVRILYQELVKILGERKEISLKPQVMLMVGLYGQGKTTTCAKIAKYFQKKGLRPAFIAGDVHRPAAFDQLAQLAKQTNISIYEEMSSKLKPEKIVKNGIEKLKRQADLIIVDTAGRDKLDKELIDEMKAIEKAAKPQEKILVVDATMGQQAGSHALAFHEAIDLTGVILTKLDGTAKGGGALSAVAATKVPIAFVGTGEKLEDLEKFEPDRFISRLLGMGDLKSLLEKAKEVEVKEQAKVAAKHMAQGKFTLQDLYDQMESLSSMGPLNKIFDMLPSGLTQRVGTGDVEKLQRQLKKFKVIMDSMTQKEKENPVEVKSSQVTRIARGAGVETSDVRQLLRYYSKSKKMMKGMKGNKRMQRALAKQFGSE